MVMEREGKNLIAYCGLDCVECFVYKLTVSEAAKALRREMRAAKLKEAWNDIPFLSPLHIFEIHISKTFVTFDLIM